MKQDCIRSPFRKGVMLALAASAIAILLGLIPVNVKSLMGPVADAVLDSSGLSLSIDGPVVLRLGTRPTIRTGPILLLNPEGGKLVELSELTAAADLMPMLKGQLYLLRLTARQVNVDYCVKLPARAKTIASAEEKSAVSQTAVELAADTIRLDSVSIHCGADGRNNSGGLILRHIVGRAPRHGVLELEAAGSIKKLDFELSVSGGSLNQLLKGPAPFPIQAALSSDLFAAEATGELAKSPDGPEIDMAVSLEADDPAEIAYHFGMELPYPGQLRFDGNLLLKGAGVALRDFRGMLGQTSYAFDAGIEFSVERPSTHLRLSIPQLHLSPRPDSGEETKIDWQKFDLGRVNDIIDTVDADVEIKVEQVIGTGHAIEDVELRASLAEGRLDVSMLSAKTLGGRTHLIGSYDGQANCPALALEAQGSALALGTLHLSFGFEQADLSLSSCGATPRNHLDSLHLTMIGHDAYIAGQEAGMPRATGEFAIHMTPDQPGSLRWGEGQFDGQAFEINAAVGSLSELFRPDAWPLSLEVTGYGGKFRAEGEAAFATDAPRVHAVATLDVPKVGSLHPVVDVSPDAALPLYATAAIHFDHSRLSLELSKLILGHSTLRGELDTNLSSANTPSKLAILSDLLDLQEFAAILPEDDGSGRKLQSTHGAEEKRPSPVHLPNVNLELKFKEIRTARLNFQDLEVKGRLQEKLVNDGRVSVLVEDELQLTGSLDLDLRDQPLSAAFGFSADTVDVGRLLERAGVKEPPVMQADKIELVIRTRGDDIPGLLSNARIQARISDFLGQVPDPVAPGQIIDLRLSEVDASLEPGKPSVWSAEGDIGELPIQLRLRTASMLDVMDRSRNLPVLLAVNAGKDTALLDASIDRSSDDALRASLSLSGARLDGSAVPIEKLEHPLEDYQVRGHISLSESRLAVTGLRLQLGSSIAEGGFSVSLEEPRHRYKLALHAPHLQTEDIRYFAGTGVDEVIPAGKEDRKEVAGKPREFLDKLRRHNDIEIELAIDELVAEDERLGGATLHLHADQNGLRLKPITVNLPGGDVEAEYFWQKTGERFHSRLRANTEALRYGGLLPLIDSRWQTEGLAYLDIDLQTDTAWTEEMPPLDLLVQNADGYLRAAVWPKGIETRAIDLWTSNLILAVLPIGSGGRQSELNCLVVLLDSTNGLMKTDATLLDSTDSIIRLRGEVDYAQRLLNLLVIPQAKQEKFFSVSTPVRVTGPFNDYRIGVEPGGLMGLAIKWWMNLVYVPFKWLTGERFPADGTETCFEAMDLELTPEMEEYFRARDFARPPPQPLTE